MSEAKLMKSVNIHPDLLESLAAATKYKRGYTVSTTVKTGVAAMNVFLGGCGPYLHKVWETANDLDVFNFIDAPETTLGSFYAKRLQNLDDYLREKTTVVLQMAGDLQPIAMFDDDFSTPGGKINLDWTVMTSTRGCCPLVIQHTPEERVAAFIQAQYILLQGWKAVVVYDAFRGKYFAYTKADELTPIVTSLARKLATAIENFHLGVVDNKQSKTDGVENGKKGISEVIHIKVLDDIREKYHHLSIESYRLNRDELLYAEEANAIILKKVCI